MQQTAYSKSDSVTVFECVGECDFECGSTKRIWVCVVAVSLLLHIDAERVLCHS